MLWVLYLTCREVRRRNFAGVFVLSKRRNKDQLFPRCQLQLRQDEKKPR